MYVADVDTGILAVFAVTSLHVYAVALGGWASNSKFPLLGGVRASAQMISYEIALGLSVLGVFIVVGDLRLISVVEMQTDGWMIGAGDTLRSVGISDIVMLSTQALSKPSIYNWSLV